MEKKAIVLDKIKKEIKFKQTPIVQAISTYNFALLEVVYEENVRIQDVISTENKMVKKINYNNLTNNSKNEIEKAIENIVINNPDRFVYFFNNAKPIGLRRHQLDLLPKIGKKHRIAIIEHIRTNGPFKSFEDIKKIEMLPDPIMIITKRIIDEIIDHEDIKYYLFTTPKNKL